jgi:hypothetical protein
MEYTELEKQILLLLEEVSGELAELKEIQSGCGDDLPLITFHLSSLIRIILARAVFRETARRMGL